MSSPPRIQLGLFGGEEPVIVAEVDRVVGELAPAPPRCEVSAERRLLAAQTSMIGLAIDPPEIEGWRDIYENPPDRPRIVNGVCTELIFRRRVDGSLAPCARVTCPNHLLLDFGEVVEIQGRRYAELRLNRAGAHPVVMGRRPGLAAIHTDGEADAFGLDALERLDELPDTCRIEAQRRVVPAALPEELEVERELRVEDLNFQDPRDFEWQERERAQVEKARREQNADRRAAALARDDAARVDVTAAALGLSEEQIRLDTHSAGASIGVRFVNGQPEPADPERAEEILAAHLPTKIRRTYRGKVGVPPPVPRAIVRVERDAPPPREPTAADLFTF